MKKLIDTIYRWKLEWRNYIQGGLTPSEWGVLLKLRNET